MPPRKSTRRQSRPSKGAKKADASSGLAAREVWTNPHVRQNILRCLDKPDLARCMGVDKTASFDVARDLYRLVDDKVLTAMHQVLDKHNERHQMYYNAVTEIHFDSSDMLDTCRASLYRKTEGDPEAPHTTQFEIYDLHEEGDFTYLQSNLMPLFHKKFRNLRRLVVRPKDMPNDQWTIHCDPIPINESSPSDASAKKRPSSITLIDISEDPQCRYWRPSTSFQSPYLTSVHPIRYRFNFDTGYNGKHGPYPTEIKAEWLTAIREDPAFANIYKTASFAELPVTLSDLQSLFERQVSPDGQRLTNISAPHIFKWTPDDFTSFAGVFGASLTVLDLGSETRETAPSIQDLCAIVPVIRTNLTSLKKLRVSVRSMVDAEAVCLPLLGPDSLELEGTLEKFTVSTNRVQTSLFSTLRYFSQLCKTDAKMEFIAKGSASSHGFDGNGRRIMVPEWKGVKQADFLRLLKARPLVQRRHLAHVDFQSLDITKPAQIEELEYTKDGQPIRRLRTKAAKWPRHAAEIKTLHKRHLVPNTNEALNLMRELTTAFKEVAEDDSLDPEEVLERLGSLEEGMAPLHTITRQLLRVSNEIGAATKEMEDMGRIMRRGLGIQTEDDLEKERYDEDMAGED